MTSPKREWLINQLSSLIVVGMWLLLSWLASLAIPGATWDRALLLIVAFSLAERLPAKEK